jgi:hypothetical protein
MCVLGKPCFKGACVLWVRVCVLDMLCFLGECVCVCVCWICSILWVSACFG